MPFSDHQARLETTGPPWAQKLSNDLRTGPFLIRVYCIFVADVGSGFDNFQACKNLTIPLQCI